MPTRQRGLPEVPGLSLVLGAVHLSPPAVGQSPWLVGVHREQGVMARLPSSQRLDHRDVQIAGHGLVWARVAVVKGELLGSVVRVFITAHRCVHVLRAERGSGRLGARLERTPPHPARVVAVTKVAVRQRGGGGGALVWHGGCWAWSSCALLPRRRARLAGAWSRHVHCGVPGRRVHQAGRVTS